MNCRRRMTIATDSNVNATLRTSTPATSVGAVVGGLDEGSIASTDVSSIRSCEQLAFRSAGTGSWVLRCSGAWGLARRSERSVGDDLINVEHRGAAEAGTSATTHV